ncbi:MAG: rhamnulokinase [Pirellulales bacterium]|nr:rhamnulokinase [Pirellulales bacterium]
MAEQAFIGVDLGASGGRVLVGLFDGKNLRLDEAHRFGNGPTNVAGTLHWDLLALWNDVQAGLRRAGAKYKGQIRSVGVDTWGVDFGLLGRGDTLLGNPVHYRDRRTEGMPTRAFRYASREAIFAATGLQFMPFNTLFQLLAMREGHSPLLDVAERMLMMPDLFHWLLSGEKTNEITNATTTQCFNPQTGRWATDLLQQCGLAPGLFGELVQAGADIGALRRDVAEATELANVRVVLPGTHDTASAVMAVPAQSDGGGPWAYLSSGTWALLGVEIDRPIVNDRCRELNFTNEGGVGGTIRLLKNITGLWLVQECRRVWSQAGRDYSWEELTRLAAEAPSLASLVDPDDASFAAPTDMPVAIREYCLRTRQPVPESEGAVIRTAIESIALRSRQVLGWVEELSGQRIKTLHIVGGGTQNRPLCQATADACGVRVVAGPVEATAIGNVMMQAVAAGAVGSIAEARQIVARSFAVEEYAPRETDRWQEAFARFQQVTRR